MSDIIDTKASQLDNSRKNYQKNQNFGDIYSKLVVHHNIFGGFKRKKEQDTRQPYPQGLGSPEQLLPAPCHSTVY